MKYINTILIIGIIAYLGFFNEPSFGGVRGGARTGFYLMSGENIAIGTTTPLANLHIYETASTSIAIDGEAIGCLRLLDTDGGGYTNITTLNGVLGTSTDNTCGF